MRERAYEDCRDWCVSRGLRGEVLNTWPVSDVDPLLRDYGQHLFRGGAAVGEFKRVLFAIQDRRRELRRGVLSDAWGAVSKWEQKEPSDPHVPLPRVAHSAGLSLCVLWSRESPFAAVVWLEMLRALVLGWVALARARGEVAIASSPSTASLRPLRPGAGRLRGLRASEGAVVAPRA